MLRFWSPARPAFRRVLIFLWLAGLTCRLAAQNNPDLTVYTDSIQNSWEDWSFNTTKNFNYTGTAHSGTKSISTTITASYGGLSFHHSDIDASSYTNLTFWVNGGASGGQLLQVFAELGAVSKPAVSIPKLATNIWQQITISLAALGIANQPNFTRFTIQNRTAAALPVFYVDDISLVGGPLVTNRQVTITVDAQKDRHPISPLIYGIAWASTAELQDLNAPLNRSGGNSESRYNWLNNSHNRAADWYFQSLADGSATPGAEGDNFVTTTKAAGAQPLLTIPMIGWMPKIGPNRGKLASFSIAKYGPQTGSDAQWMPDAGNGVSTFGTNIINDPNDANFPTNSDFQKGWVQHLTNKWGTAASGGVRYYIMDNEHTLWHSTHRDIHPVGPTMQEIRDKIFDYGEMVKAIDPNAIVLGPEEWSWPGYIRSGYDQQTGGNTDRNANGGKDYMPWLLDQMRQHDQTNGHRLLDVFTLHCYPQGGESGDDVTPATQTLRNRSTRQFWDTNYVDASWIAQIISLIPRMKSWVATNYPGTKTGITEYNWGAENHINGATAQADLYGLFGREGLDLGTRWTTPAASTPTYKAMKMYRNYDGNKSTFGDTNVAALTAINPDYVSVFAAQRSNDNALTVIVINKQVGATATLALTLTNFSASSTVQHWQLTSNNVITRLSDHSLPNNTLNTTLPAQSINLFIAPGAPPTPVLRDAAIIGDNNFRFWLDGQAGQRYTILTSTNYFNWSPVQTNTLISNSTNFTFSVASSGDGRYYRAQWTP